MKRSEKRVSAAQQLDEAMQHLPNPFDEMSIDEKKQMALFLCKRRLKVCDFVCEFCRQNYLQSHLQQEAISLGQGVFQSKAKIDEEVANEVIKVVLFCFMIHIFSLEYL